MLSESALRTEEDSMKVIRRITVETRTITIIRPRRSGDSTDLRESTPMGIDKIELVSDTGEPVGDLNQDVRGNHEKLF